MFVPLHCLNFGIGGDQTQHVLWRIQNGELDNIAPKVNMVSVGNSSKIRQHSSKDKMMSVENSRKTRQHSSPKVKWCQWEIAGNSRNNTGGELLVEYKYQ